MSGTEARSAAAAHSLMSLLARGARAAARLVFVAPPSTLHTRPFVSLARSPRRPTVPRRCIALLCPQQRAMSSAPSTAAVAAPKPLTLVPGKTRVGFIGIGVMGLSMAGHLQVGGTAQLRSSAHVADAPRLCMSRSLCTDSPKTFCAVPSATLRNSATR